MSECIIVGAGLMGMLTARELRRAGLVVTLLDRGEAGKESSWAGGGILSPLHPWRYPQAVTALVRWSQEQYPALAAELLLETGVDPQWTRSGLLILDHEEQAQALAWGRDTGTVIEPIGRETIHRIEPALHELDGSALWIPGVAQVRNPRLVRALKRGLLASGVRILEHTEVTGFVGQGRVTGVTTATQELRADVVVIAAGAWTGVVLRALHLSVPIEPVRGQMLVFRAPPGTLSRIVLYRDRYLIPRRDGRVLVGSTMERVGFDKSITEEARAALRQAATLIPALAGCEPEHHWAGLRPGTPQGIPLIAGHPALPGLYVNAGQFRNGVATGPASARLLADLILDREPIVPVEPYALPG